MTKVLQGVRHRLKTSLSVCHIQNQGHHFGAAVEGQLRGKRIQACLVAGDQTQRGPFFGKGMRNGRTNAATGPRDEGD